MDLLQTDINTDIAMITFDSGELYRSYFTMKCEPTENTFYAREICFATESTPISWRFLLSSAYEFQIEEWISSCFYKTSVVQIADGDWKLEITPGKREASFLKCQISTGKIIKNFTWVQMPKGFENIHVLQSDKVFHVEKRLAELKQYMTPSTFNAIGERGIFQKLTFRIFISRWVDQGLLQFWQDCSTLFGPKGIIEGVFEPRACSP